MTDPTEPTEPPARPTAHLAPGEPAAEIADPGDPAEAPREVDPATETETSEAPKRRDPLPVLFGIGVLVLIGAVVFLWRHPLNLASFSSQPSQQQAATPPEPAAPAPSAPGDSSQAAATPPSPPSSPVPPPAVPAPPPIVPTPPPAVPASSPAVPASPAAAPTQADTGTPPPPTPVAPRPDTPAAVTPDQLATLQQQVDKLQQQVEALAQRPTPPVTDLGPLTQRVDAIEHRPAPPPPPDLTPALAALGSRIDTLATRLDQVVSKEGADAATAGSRQDAADAKLATVAKQSADLAGLSEHTTRVARIQAAANALAAGRPLGELADAPPALARYRTDPPPTEASLRLGFPAAAQAATAAGQPDTAAMPFWDAVRDRAESLVTVRRGDHVMVGDQSSGSLARARTALDAGDLAGAVAAVATLSGPPAAAMAPWTTQAKALLDARAALAAMAARA